MKHAIFRTVVVVGIVGATVSGVLGLAWAAPRSVTHKVPKSVNQCGHFECRGTSWSAAASSNGDFCYYTHEHYD
jgi:hypothetical protein